MKERDGRPLRKGPLLGVDNLGNRKIMHPGQDYQFPGDQVFEIPYMQQGGSYTNPNAEAKGRYLKNFTTTQVNPLSIINYTGRSNEGVVSRELPNEWYNTGKTGPSGNPIMERTEFTDTRPTTNAYLKNNVSVNMPGTIDEHEKMLKKLNRSNFTGSHGFRGRGWDTGLSDEAKALFKEENPFFKKGRVRTLDYDLTNASNPSKNVTYSGYPSIVYFADGGVPMAQTGLEVKQRRGVRNNPDGSVSSHLMKTEYVDGRGWVAFPTLFQDSKPYADDNQNWVDMSEDEDWMKIYEEAVRRGEVYDFGEDKEAALAFGMGSWKDQLPEHLQDKKYGGIPKGQTGGTIYVDPNDPAGRERYRAYQDSLSLYNDAQGQIKYFRKLGINPGEFKIPTKDVNPSINYVKGFYSEKDIKTLNRIKPLYYLAGSKNKNSDGVYETSLLPVFKKPTQPVKYGDPEVVAKQQQLIAAGYDIGPTGADGIWGPKSQTAWEEYQNNKIQDGTSPGENEFLTAEPYEGSTNNTTTTNTNGTVEVPSWKQVWIEDPESPAEGYWKKVYTGTKIDVSPPQYQTGGPIIVPQGDYRAQAYADSLTLYNQGRRTANAIDPFIKDKGYITWDEWKNSYYTDPNTARPTDYEAFERLMKLNQESPAFGKGTKKIEYPIGDIGVSPINEMQTKQYALYAKPKNIVFEEGSKEAQNAEKQKELKEAGLYEGDIDGIWGEKSQAAWEAYEASLKPVEEDKPTEEIKETETPATTSDSDAEIIGYIRETYYDTDTNSNQTKYRPLKKGEEVPTDGTFVSAKEMGGLLSYRMGGVPNFTEQTRMREGSYNKRREEIIDPRFRRAQTGTETKTYKNVNNLLTYKNNPDWFDSRAVYHDIPAYDNMIREKIYSGNYGYDPSNQSIHPLAPEDRVVVSDEVNNIRAKEKKTIAERDRVGTMSPEAQEADRKRKIASQLRAENRQPMTIDEIGSRSNPLLREEDKTGRRPWEGKEGQTLFLTPEETTAYYKDWVAKSNVAMGENPLFYAPGIIGASAFAPAALAGLGEATYGALAPAFSAPATIAGTTIPVATAGNLINAGFAGHGLYNVFPDAIDFATNPSWEGAGNLAIDALEIAPIARAAGRGTVEGYNAAKQVANKLGNKYVPKQLPGSPNSVQNLKNAEQLKNFGNKAVSGKQLKNTYNETAAPLTKKSVIEILNDKLKYIKKHGPRVIKETIGGLLSEFETQRSITKGNKWLKEWIDDAVTQHKIDKDMGDMFKVNADKYAEELSFLNNSDSNNYIIADELTENAMSKYMSEMGKRYQSANETLAKEIEVQKSFTPNADTYPIPQQWVDLFKTKGNVHTGNAGVSWRHNEEVLNPKRLKVDKSNYEEGTWISRLGNKKESTTVHEGTHDWVTNKVLRESGQRDKILNALTAESKNNLKVYQANRSGEGLDNYLGYLADPAEVHARIMELRKFMNIKPGQKVNEALINYIKNRYSMPLSGQGKPPIDKRFFDLFKSDKDLADLFNTLWAVPAVGIVGASAASQYQKGGEIDTFTMYKNYVNGDYDGTKQEKKASEIYDKLNRVYYRDAKAINMTPANYILTHVTG
jgi:hypothetical protein